MTIVQKTVNTPPPQMVYPPMLNNVSCTDADTDFTSCEFVIDHECGHQADVYLNCGAQTHTEFMCPPGASYQVQT